MAEIKTPLFKRIYQLHRVLGLLCALHILVLSLTGIILVWKDEIENTQQSLNQNIELSEDTKSSSLASIYGNIEKKLSVTDGKILAIYENESLPGTWTARLSDGSPKFRGSEKIPFSSHGERLDKSQMEGSLGSGMDFILEIHRELLLGTIGKLYIGIIGAFLLLSLLSGLYILPKFSKNTSVFNLQYLKGRLGASQKHKFIGVGIWGWCAVVFLSGSLLSFNSLLIKSYFNYELKELSSSIDVKKGQGYVSSQVALEKLALASGDFSPYFLSFPDNEFSLDGAFVALMADKAKGVEQRLAVVSAYDGEVLRISELPLFLKLLVWSEPLHFGDYGGVSLKIAWSAMGLLLIYLSLSGLKIFLFRTKRIKSIQSKPVITQSKSKHGKFKALGCTLSAPLLLAGYWLDGALGEFGRAGFILFCVWLLFDFGRQLVKLRE